MNALQNREKIEARIAITQKYLRHLFEYQKEPKEKILEEGITQSALERVLQLATQSVIDLADAFIAFKKYRMPTSLAETFEILKDEEVINRELCKKLVSMAKFRNVLVHLYTEIDHEKVYQILMHGPRDIEKFLNIISKNY